MYLILFWRNHCFGNTRLIVLPELFYVHCVCADSLSNLKYSKRFCCHVTSSYLCLKKCSLLNCDIILNLSHVVISLCTKNAGSTLRVNVTGYWAFLKWQSEKEWGFNPDFTFFYNIYTYLVHQKMFLRYFTSLYQQWWPLPWHYLNNLAHVMTW